MPRGLHSAPDWAPPCLGLASLPSSGGVGPHLCVLAPSQDPSTVWKPTKGLLKRREVEGSLGYRNALSG